MNRTARPPLPNRPVAADAEAMFAAAEGLEAEGGSDHPSAVTVNRCRARLGWGSARADRAYHDLLNSGRWRWRRLEDHPGSREAADAYVPTEADIEAVRASWTPAEERRRRRWQIRGASIPGADRYGVKWEAKAR